MLTGLGRIEYDRGWKMFGIATGHKHEPPRAEWIDRYTAAGVQLRLIGRVCRLRCCHCSAALELKRDGSRYSERPRESRTQRCQESGLSTYWRNPKGGWGAGEQVHWGQEWMYLYLTSRRKGQKVPVSERFLQDRALGLKDVLWWSLRCSRTPGKTFGQD